MDETTYSKGSHKSKRQRENANNRMSKFGYDIKSLDEELKEIVDDIINFGKILESVKHSKESIENDKLCFSDGEFGEKINTAQLDINELQIRFLENNLLFLRPTMCKALKTYKQLKSHPSTSTFEDSVPLQNSINEMYKVSSSLRTNEFYMKVLSAIYDLDRNVASRKENEVQIYGRFTEGFEKALTKVCTQDKQVISEVCNVISTYFPEINLNRNNEIENN